MLRRTVRTQSYRLARYKPVGRGSDGRVKPIWLPNKYVLHAQKWSTRALSLFYGITRRWSCTSCSKLFRTSPPPLISFSSSSPRLLIASRSINRFNYLIGNRVDTRDHVLRVRDTFTVTHFSNLAPNPFPLSYVGGSRSLELQQSRSFARNATHSRSHFLNLVSNPFLLSYVSKVVDPSRCDKAEVLHGTTINGERLDQNGEGGKRIDGLSR